MRGKCPTCGRIVGVVNPRGGDGSVRRTRRHLSDPFDKHGRFCAGGEIDTSQVSA